MVAAVVHDGRWTVECRLNRYENKKLIQIKNKISDKWRKAKTAAMPIYLLKRIVVVTGVKNYERGIVSQLEYSFLIPIIINNQHNYYPDIFDGIFVFRKCK